jgi:hypothetical protein
MRWSAMGTSHCGPMCLVQIFSVGRCGSVGSLERAVPFIRSLIVRGFIRLKTLVFHVPVASVFKVSVAFAACWTLIAHTFPSLQDSTVSKTGTGWSHRGTMEFCPGRDGPAVWIEQQLAIGGTELAV